MACFNNFLPELSRKPIIFGLMFGTQYKAIVTQFAFVSQRTHCTGKGDCYCYAEKGTHLVTIEESAFPVLIGTTFVAPLEVTELIFVNLNSCNIFSKYSFLHEPPREGMASAPFIRDSTVSTRPAAEFGPQLP